MSANKSDWGANSPRPDKGQGSAFSERHREAIREANATVRARLNATKVIFPLLSAVELRAPDTALNEDAVFRLFSEMIDVSRRLANEVAQAIKGSNVTESEWINRAVMPLCAQMVGNAWTKHQRLPTDFDAQALRVRVAFALTHVVAYDGGETDLEDRAAIQLSTLAAMVPVVHEIEIHSLGHQKSDVAERLRRAMTQGAEVVVTNIAPDLASTESRRKLLHGVLQQCGEIMAECYRQEVTRFRACGQDIPQAVADQNPVDEGWSLNALKHSFERRLSMVAACAVHTPEPEAENARDPYFAADL
jgi:hypothetical protein